MKLTKIAKAWLVWLIILFGGITLLASFSQVNADDEEESSVIELNEDTVWHKDDNLVFNKSVFVNPGVTLTIEKGAEVKFEFNPKYGPSGLYVFGGKILAEGTQREPIKLTSASNSNNFFIEFQYDKEEGIPDPGPSFFRYVEISKGGHSFSEGNQTFNNLFNWFSSPVYAYFDDGTPAVYFSGGKVYMENCWFRDNAYADVGIEYYEDEDNLGSSLSIVNSNFEKSNDSWAVKSTVECLEEDSHCSDRIILKNNWYGDPNGPSGEVSNSETTGKKVVGPIKLEGWRKNSLVADPVVIIPGIMGSTEVFGGLEIDPILHTYDDLIASLEKNGYEKDKNLFEFPYDWRNNNETSAQYLETAVEGIIQSTSVSKVDLVAHSMGGLVSRAYIEEVADGVYYNNTVDQLITLGTPHGGSPKSYLKWEAGAGFKGILDMLAEHHFKQEAKHNGYSDIYAYIRGRVGSVRDLLPINNYLFDANQNSTRTYFDNYPRNIFLEELNSPENLEKLKEVKFTNIVGVLDNDQSTISKIRVIDSTVDGRWENGMPENFYNENTDQGLEYDSGDSVVPKADVENIVADNVIEVNSAHDEIPTVAQCEVFQELTGLNECSRVEKFHVPNILLFNVFSPVDIQVVAPDGKRVGKDFETGKVINEIFGAFYSGSDTENEFVTIPNPLDGKYQILTQGTGEGEYKIETTKISEDQNSSGKAVESTAEVKGVATLGSEEELSVEVAETEVKTEHSDSTPPTITGAPTSHPNANGWYSQDVTIHFEATDSDSEIASVTPDITLNQEGENISVTGTATDNSGNSADTTISGINIDKTAPQSQLNISGTKGNNDWYISNVKVEITSADNLSGIAGNYISVDKGEFVKTDSLSLDFEGEHIIGYYAEDKAGNKEAFHEMKVKIDKSSPEVTVVSPENKSYSNDKIIGIKYAAKDSLTATNKLRTSLFLDGQSFKEKNIDLSLMHLGKHTFSVLTEDEAGNRNEESPVSFQIGTNIQALENNVGHYANLGLITTLKTRCALAVELGVLETKLDLLAVFKNKWMPKWAKDRVVSNLEREINRDIDRIISDIQSKKNFSETIRSQAKELLIECLKSIKV